MFNLGLSISYDRVLSISTDLGNRICRFFQNEGTVCRPELKSDLFTTGAVDNIDHNLSSTSAHDSFHGTGISLFQHPNSDSRGVQRVNPDDTSTTDAHLPQSYTIVPPVLGKCDPPVPKLAGPNKSNCQLIPEAMQIEYRDHMPPKRKGASKSARAKKVKVEDAAGSDEKKKIEALKKAPDVKSKAKIDSCCTLDADNSEIVDDFDCMLNQTNINQNNNKFYIIQLIFSNKVYHMWNRWGRVGEIGQSKLSSFASLDIAKKDFVKKFKDKTKNDWDKRENFKAFPGKYTMIEVQRGEEGEETVEVDTVSGKLVNRITNKCTLDEHTQKLIKLIFNNDMFNDAMQQMNLDIKKMPLGKLSKNQIAKGFEVLEEIEESMKTSSGQKNLADLSSRFYTVIPHNFGRSRPSVIDDAQVIRMKKDMLLVLTDIVLAQSLKTETEEKEIKEETQMVPHDDDLKYELLKCKLELLKDDDPQFQVITKYVEATAPPYLKFLQAWVVRREGEEERFKDHSNIENRRLLWHGTNVAVVAAILKSGLRIMPHSGGCVGRGIYFASENSKSAGYVGCTSDRLGLMFLGEVALGKEQHIMQGDSSLKKAPNGFDSIVARGRTEPDPKQDTVLKLDEKKVMVPQGKPVVVSKFKKSSFCQSEYLIYKESQCMIRYLLLFQF
uniref:protein mono-ADP-ribosyltransferase PARP3 isoform X1 n=2 Tax=Myxine glutinosa TaxID=7769 RepID=UPI0035902B8E